MEQSKYRILIIEDDEGIAHLAKKHLERNGFTADCAFDGNSALTQIKEERYDLMLLDFALPDMKADELLESMEKLRKNVPFIITTGHGCEKIAVEFMKRGAKDYIVKDDNFWDFLNSAVTRYFAQISTEDKLKKAEVSLEEKSALNQMILDAIPFETVLLDINKTVLECNKFAKENNVRIGDEYCICDFEHCKIEKAFKEKKPQMSEVDINGKIHEVHWVPLNEFLCLCFALNINDRIEAEKERRDLTKQLQQSQKMEAIGQMTGCIAHDFNNLLSGIMGYSELLHNSLSPESREFKYNSIISETATRASEMTNKLLTFSRRKSDDFREVNIRKILENTLELFKHSCKNIDLVVNMDSKENIIMGNEDQLQNSFLNILINAKDAINENGRLEVTTRNISINNNFLANILNTISHGEFIEVIISDNGSGMSEDTLARIFEPFFTTKKTKGTGLGLSSTYGHMRSHKGAINVKSKEGSGSEFHLYFPLKAMMDSSPPKEDGNIKKNSPQKNEFSKKIVVVDDEKMALDISKLLLEEIGHEVITFSSDYDFLTYLQNPRNIFDILIIDLNLHQMSGLDLLEKARSQRTDFLTLVISGAPEDIDTESARKKGVAGILRKPVTINDFEKAIFALNA